MSFSFCSFDVSFALLFSYLRATPPSDFRLLAAIIARNGLVVSDEGTIFL
jgi:hypothetical protein